MECMSAMLGGSPMRRCLSIFLTALLVAACRSPSAAPAPGPSQSPAGRPTVQPAALLVVLMGPGRSSTDPFPATLKVLTRDGKDVASVDFQAPGVPIVGNAESIMPPLIRVQAGGAYFLDASGDIRRLGRDGKVQAVTRLPILGRRQFVSFAVSPDGATVLASIL